MRRQNIGYAVLATVLLVAPACGRSEEKPGVSPRDTAAPDRSSQVTNGRDAGEQKAPAPEDRRMKGATGTTGSALREADEAAEAGPDAIITMKIQAKYASDDVVKGRNIEVDTENGVVTLKGSAESLRQRDAAEQLARETSGVKRVVNELKVATR